MYERHFAMTELPFRLNPDPAFFYASEQHRGILEALKEAFDHALPILVLSGEMGAGKTTILRTWMEDCRARGVVVAQLANTQLVADELLWAICTGFGVAGASDAEGSRAALRRVFDDLNGGPALLVVDEAQNLQADGFQALVELGKMAADEGAVLRICVAGQPELRQRVALPALIEFRSLVQKSWHLGPFAAEETRSYVEHRLAKVGWAGRPAIDATAFAEIRRLTGGVPRRINVLCNRLLLSQYLNKLSNIDGRSVLDAATAMEAELEEGVFTDRAVDAPPPIQTPPARVASGSLMLVASGRSDHIKAMSLLTALAARPDLPPAVVVSTSDATTWAINQDLLDGHKFAQVGLARATDVMPALEHLGKRFGDLIEKSKPAAIVIFDGSLVTQMCATLAHERELAVVHIGSRAENADEPGDDVACRIAIGRLASLRFDSQPRDQQQMSGRAHHAMPIGNLLIDSVRLAVKTAESRPNEVGARVIPFVEGMTEADRNGYGVVALRQSSERHGWHGRKELMALLHAVGRDLPLVWPMRLSNLVTKSKENPKSKSRERITKALAEFRVTCIEELNHREFVDLLLDATCVLTDSPDVMEEAAALRLPCLSLDESHAGAKGVNPWMTTVHVGLNPTRATRAVWDILFRGAAESALPADWDGHAGARIAAQIARWLAELEAASKTPLG